MNIVPAAINMLGAERVVELVNDPRRFTQSPRTADLIANNRWSTVWIPGITISHVEFLDKPFGVQVEGDIEPFSTSLTWRPRAEECIEASFTGYLTASDISKSGVGANDYKLRKVRDAFEALSEFGGFLHTTILLTEIEESEDLDGDIDLVIDKRLITESDLEIDAINTANFQIARSQACFFFNETVAEHHRVLKLMTEHGVSPNDFVLATKIRNLIVDIPDIVSINSVL